jgi:pyruvate dehydrogenase E1 component alpha subunit
MISDAYSTDIKLIQVMDTDGKIDDSLLPKNINDDKILEMYRMMLYARNFDAKVLSLQRQGRAVTYAPLIGEEATQIGSAMAMRSNDIFVPSFRQHAVFIARGMPLDLIFLYWRGYEEGNIIPQNVKGYPVIVPVSTQLPHASGIAFAQKYLKTGSAVVTYVGDGGTSEGDFYETMNFAGVWDAPLVLIIENNQWAISVPRSKQTMAQTLAQKAIAAGINAVQVDGNDVLAVYKATQDAITKSQSGPTVIECVTYRMSLHTTADDPTKYRSDSEVEAWKVKDPILRVRKYLASKGIIDEKIDKEIIEAQTAEIDAAVEKAEQFKPDPSAMFTNVYSFMPQVLQNELDNAKTSNFWV